MEINTSGQHLEGVYTNKDVSKITGISGRNIINYAEKQIVIPGRKSSSGQGSFRQYDLYNLFEFSLLKALQDTGMILKQIKKPLLWLEESNFIATLCNFLLLRHDSEKRNWDALVENGKVSYESIQDTGVFLTDDIAQPKMPGKLKRFWGFKEYCFEKMDSSFAKMFFLQMFSDELAELNIVKSNRMAGKSAAIGSDEIKAKNEFKNLILKEFEKSKEKNKSLKLTYSQCLSLINLQSEQSIPCDKMESNKLLLDIIDGKVFQLRRADPEIRQNEAGFNTCMIVDLFKIATDMFSNRIKLCSNENDQEQYCMVLADQKEVIHSESDR